MVDAINTTIPYGTFTFLEFFFKFVRSLHVVLGIHNELTLHGSL